jgi:hypothetical protein
MRCAPLALVLLALALPATASWISPFVSELHYDNAGADVDEFVAVTGPDGLALAGWQVVLYNGNNGQSYATVALDGVLDGGANGLAEAYWAVSGIQNGPADALALVSAAAQVIDFIAYEGQVTAADGPAQGLTARALPFAEGSGTPVGDSLQRIGRADEWAWIAAPATPGLLNPGLVQARSGSLPATGVALLWLSALLGWLVAARRGEHADRIWVGLRRVR